MWNWIVLKSDLYEEIIYREKKKSLEESLKMSAICPKVFPCALLVIAAI